MLSKIYIDNDRKVAYTVSVSSNEPSFRLYQQGIGDHNQIFFADDTVSEGNVDVDWQVIQPTLDWWKSMPKRTAIALMDEYRNLSIFGEYIRIYEDAQLSDKAYYIRVRTTYEGYYKIVGGTFEEACSKAEQRLLSEMNVEIEGYSGFDDMTEDPDLMEDRFDAEEIIQDPYN